jgi:hypothetical protein
VNPPGMLLALITLLPLTVLLAERFDRDIDEATIKRLARICCWFVILQASVGIWQYAASGNSDAVGGTPGLLDFLGSRITIMQLYFTFLIFGMLLFLFTAPKTPLSYVAIVAGIVVCGLAQSGHQTVFFAVALAVVALARFSRPVTALTTLAVAASVFVLAAFLYPSTTANVSNWYYKIVDDPYSPKRIATEGGLAALRDVKNLTVGAGLGQFSSRAALITSNEYLTVKLPPAVSGTSEYFVATIRPAMAVFEVTGEGSAISKPYSSALSMAVECGFLLSATLLVLLVWEIRRNSRMMRSSLRAVSMTGMMANVGLLFFVLCCCIENYAEFPVAIFIPGLLYVAARSHARWALVHIQHVV